MTKILDVFFDRWQHVRHDFEFPGSKTTKGRELRSKEKIHFNENLLADRKNIQTANRDVKERFKGSVEPHQRPPAAGCKVSGC